MKKTVNNSKVIVAPESTGGSGFVFENMISAYFSVLMICSGKLSFVPTYKIVKLAWQTKSYGHELDDLKLELKNDVDDVVKVLIQIKRTIEVTASNKAFKETIIAAWKDFNDSRFNKEKDVLLLVTGPLLKKDYMAIVDLTNYARRREETFWKMMEEDSTISKNKRQSFKIILEFIKEIEPNGIDKQKVLSFLRRFYVLLPDDKHGDSLVDSFALSLLDQTFGNNNGHYIFNFIYKFVSHCNEVGGDITKKALLSRLKQECLISDSFEAYTTLNVDDSLDVSKNELLLFLEKEKINKRYLALLSLVGEWDNASKNDRLWICNLLRCNELQLDDMLDQLSSYPSSKLIEINCGIVHLSNRKMLWKSVGDTLLPADLKNYETEINNLLGQIEETLDNSYYGREGIDAILHTVRESMFLRKGAVKGLALFSTFKNICSRITHSDCEALFINIYRSIFKGKDWHIWATLNDLLPFFAEAKPQYYCKYLNSLLILEDGGIKNLFESEMTGLLGTSNIVGLVNSLGVLAWSNTMFYTAVELLFKMGLMDPGGQWFPRPISVLEEIFSPYVPHTWVEIDYKMTVFESFLLQYPNQMSWNLLTRLLTPRESYSNIYNGPLFSDEGEKKLHIASSEETNLQLNRFLKLAIKCANNNVQRLDFLLKTIFYNSVFDITFKDFYDYLIQNCDNFSDEEKAVIWNCVNTMLQKYDTISKKNIITEEKRALYNNIKLKYESNDIRSVARVLFNKTTSYRNKKELSKKRQLLAKFVSLYGIVEAFDFIRTTASPYNGGQLLGEIGTQEYDTTLFSELNIISYDDNMFYAYQGYIQKRFEKQGWAWVSEQGIEKWPQEKALMFCMMLPFRKEVWDYVNIKLKQMTQYWKLCKTSFVDKKELQEAIGGLLSVNRTLDALDILHTHVNVDSKLHLQILNEIVNNGIEERLTELQQHNIVESIIEIQRDPSILENDKLKIEFYFSALVKRLEHGSGFIPKTIEAKMAKDINFFCDMLKYAYMPDTNSTEEQKPNLTPNETQFRKNVSIILTHWRIPPGVREDLTFDNDLFSKWTMQMFTRVKEINRVSSAEMVLGRVLIYVPEQPFPLWLPTSVADFLNREENENIRNTYRRALYNARGPHLVDVTGKQELELAKSCDNKREILEKHGYFKLAQVFRKLEETYKDEAIEVLEEAKRREEYYKIQRET